MVFTYVQHSSIMLEEKEIISDSWSLRLLRATQSELRDTLILLQKLQRCSLDKSLMCTADF